MIMPVDTKWGMARRALVVAVTLLSVTVISQAQFFEPEVHPNHYIVLVDASGSSIESRTKRDTYKRALTERLPLLLYNSGFGKMIPPIDPESDSLTLLQFGIVDIASTPGYTRLKDYDLINDFIHRVIYRSGHAGQDEFKSRVVPQHHYGLTVLSWAKQIALATFSARDSNAGSNRTFLIMISDEIANGGVPAAEISTVETFGNRNSVDRVKDLVRTINSDYQFTDGLGKEGWAFQEKIPTSDRPLFFIEAFEVVSVAQAKWEADAKGLRPLSRLEIEWTKQSGAAPEGVLIARTEDGFLRRLGLTTDLTATMSVASDVRNSETPWHLGSSLRMPFSVRDELTCESKSIDTLLQIPITQTDDRLGARTVNYLYRHTVSAPPAFRCTAVFVLRIGLTALLAALALFALGYYLYYRLWATHVEVEIPGTLGSIRLRRRGSHSARVHMTPQQDLEALSVSLPSRLKQWLLYRGATVTLINGEDNGPLGWLDGEGPDQLRLPLLHGNVPACWRHPTAKPSKVTVSFRHGRQQTDVTLMYPRALAGSFMRSPTMTANRIKAYVALDLGSESMAAYFEDRQRRNGMINMQDYAEPLLGQDGNLIGREPDLLMQDSGEAAKVSPRLSNRVSFRAQAQPREPKDDHAKLRFVVPAVRGSGEKNAVLLPTYEKSLFCFFHRVEEWPPTTGVLPNPKILFQQQVTEILSRVDVGATDGGQVKLSPEMLIQHLTVQVLTNFVLSSPELRLYDHNEIHLTVTVPNIYSLPHAESIKQFVRRCAPNLADVQVLSESDAVGYYALKTIDQQRDSPELIAFKRAWTKELEQSGKLCLVTIDVGKGTTDLSCILVQNPPKRPSALWRLLGRKPPGEDAARRRRHSVQGKTGKSSGGNYLSYILARYYDGRLREAAQRDPLLLGQELPFGFITLATEQHRNPQRMALSALENLIERVKRSMNENFEIDVQSLSATTQRTMLEHVVDRILTGIKDEWEKTTGEERKTYEAFKTAVVKALELPSNLEGRSGAGFFKRRFPFNKARSATDDLSLQTGDLKSDLSSYVAQNVGELFESLEGLVRAHQAVSDDRAHIDNGTFVVVSGQASQFKPLRAAIKRKCKDLGINDDQVLLMRGVESKEACCKGVVNFWRDNMLVVNERELHGTYGCIDHLTGAFTPFDMERINNEGSDRIVFEIESEYLVVFTPRSKEEVEDRRPEVNDGATALLSVFEKESQFTITYDASSLQLRVNDAELAIGSFGTVDSSIYEKVWPEILKPQ